MRVYYKIDKDNIEMNREEFTKVLSKLAEQSKEIERLNSIIKEVKEYIQTCGCDDKAIDHIEEILDKVGGNSE